MTNTTTNKTHALLLRQVVNVQQTSVASAMGWDASKTSRFFSSNAGVCIDELENLLQSLNLEIALSSDQQVTVSKEEYESIKYLAHKYLEKQ